MYILLVCSRGNLTSAKTGTLAFSPENALTRNVTRDAMAIVAEDNFSFLFFLFDTNVLPQPKGYKNAQEMELALSQPNAMNHILVGIQYDDIMASKLNYLPTHFLCFVANFIYVYYKSILSMLFGI